MTTSLSQDFVANVRTLYQLSLTEISSGRVVRYGINGYTTHAAPAYVTAVAGLEAFINETLFGFHTKLFYKDSPLWLLDSDWVEKLELKHKIIIAPQLLFGQTFKKDERPYQDINMLLKVRNDVAHYKLKSFKGGSDLPKYLKDLEQRKIALRHPDFENGDFDWIQKLCTTEGIRWAHNTVCQVVNKLISFVTNENDRMPLFLLASNFVEIPETYPRDFLKEMGISDYSEE